MSLLVDRPIPIREPVHSNQCDSDEEDLELFDHLDRQRPSYRESSSLSDVPRSVYTDDGDNETYDNNMLDEYYDDVMGQEPKQSQDADPSPAPALPAKSSLRASRLLDGFDLKLAPEEPRTLSRATPQAVYMSSEEDASSSADEFSDFDLDSDAEEPQKFAGRWRSREITAKVVSVVYVGKPSIIDLPSPRRSISPEQSPERRQSRIITSSTEPSLLRRLSISSSSTGASTKTSSHPPRSSSMLTNMLSKPRPSFLSIDPYAGKSYHETVDERGEMDTPKTPTSMLKRGLSIVRKRSKPHLREGLNISRDNLSSMSTTTLPLEQEMAASTEAPGPVTYGDILRAAKKNARNSIHIPTAPPVPESPVTSTGNSRSKLLGSFHRRRSIKA